MNARENYAVFSHKAFWCRVDLLWRSHALALRSLRREQELLGNTLMGFVANTFVDCSDDDEAKIMWLIDGMEAYAAADNEVAEIRGRIKRFLIDQWVRFNHRPPASARPQIEADPDDDILF